MIRRAVDSDFDIVSADECALRIHSLKQAYGIDVPFVHYYSDDYGGLLSVMDGVGVLFCTENVDEWLIFVAMNPEILQLHCSAALGRHLMETGLWQGRVGVVLTYEGDCTFSPSCVCTTPYLPHVYTLLNECFDTMPPLDAWYPDVSHRIRHQCSKIATILDGEKVVSTAMTVAETDAFALLGQVATHSDYRGKGYAQTCINSLISRCKDKTLYILPMTDYAQSLYEKMGFVPNGDWAELQRI